MITRRSFIAAAGTTALLAGSPALSRSSSPAMLIVDPNLVGAVPHRAIVARGQALLEIMFRRAAEWQRMEAVVGEADARLLAELLRFEPRLSWTSRVAEPGTHTVAGRLLSKAHMIAALRGRAPSG